MQIINLNANDFYLTKHILLTQVLIRSIWEEVCIFGSIKIKRYGGQEPIKEIPLR